MRIEYAIEINGPFGSRTCYTGLVRLGFGFRVADVIVEAYQDYEYELGERSGIAIEPSVEELGGGETEV